MVSLIGIITALMAYGVIKTETFFFGLKTGYCSSRVLATKEQCKKGGWVTWRSFVHFAAVPHTGDGSGLLAGWKAFAVYTLIAVG